jgi:hypothetical protein
MSRADYPQGYTHHFGTTNGMRFITLTRAAAQKSKPVAMRGLSGSGSGLGLTGEECGYRSGESPVEPQSSLSSFS